MNDSEKAWSLAVACMQQGRISDCGHYIKRAKADYAATLQDLAAMPVGKYPVDSAACSFEKLRREDPKRLEQMRREDPNMLVALQDLHVAELKAKQSSKSGRS